MAECFAYQRVLHQDLCEQLELSMRERRDTMLRFLLIRFRLLGASRTVSATATCYKRAVAHTCSYEGDLAFYQGFVPGAMLT